MPRSSLNIIGILCLLSIPLFSVVGIGLYRNKITPVENFFEISISNPPHVDTNSWSLRVEGLIDNPMTWSYEKFIELPNITEIATLQCVEGPSATGRWKGVQLRKLMDEVGLKPNAKELVFYAADGFSSSLPLEDALREDVILAYEVNGVALPTEIGYPLRLVAPNKLGYKWVMWIERIEVIDYDYQGYWETRGWDDDAPLAPYADWYLHALLLSVAFILGGLALVSGLKISNRTTSFRNLPSFVSHRFHLLTSLAFVALLIPFFFYWVIQTFLLREAIFYTIHGVVSLVMVGCNIGALVTGLGNFRKTKRGREWHYRVSIFSFFLFTITILFGLALTIGMRFFP